MRNKEKWNFWEFVSILILKNRIVLILLIVLLTIFLAGNWKNVKFTFTEANLLPIDHPENVKYSSFKNYFGEEGNIISIGLKDSVFFNEKIQKLWNNLNYELSEFKEIKSILSTNNLIELKKDSKNKKLIVNKISLLSKEKLLNELPFYENLIYDKTSESIRSILFMDKEIINTSLRKDFIFKKLIPMVNEFEIKSNIDVRISGMPYVRTLNAQNIIDEIGFFVLSAILVTSIIFFLFFRSIRATLISLIVVSFGVMWSFGTLGVLNYEITVLTALIPPLIIVIGVTNCVFLINKYQQEYLKHNNKQKSLQEVIVKIGNAILLTNLTTASGFATFILTKSKVLQEFGIVASLNIIGIFFLALVLVSISYSFMNVPKKRHLKHLKNIYIESYLKWNEKIVRNNKSKIYLISFITLIFGMIGIYNLKISGSLLDDMPKKLNFFKEIKFFDNNFNGIIPLEIFIDTKRQNGLIRPSSLKKIDDLQKFITEIPELSIPLSIVNGIKFSKQAFYNGNPKYYNLPTSQENNFILPYISNSGEQNILLLNYMDSLAQFGRITTFMKDINTQKIEDIESNLNEKIQDLFSKDRYNVEITGKAILFLKGTKFLIKNLFFSLAFAILLIAIFMALMFRSFKMILISLIPNILPLIITAGLMGLIGIPLKPSTILVFSIAFGISVDFTIHYLAKYRQELISSKWQISSSAYKALRETGISLFYSGVVLFFGFSVFISSNFGGTQALGGLVSITLIIALMSNLILLPSLLISFEKYLKKR
tara:strand:- start:54 stop:2357 length:2304 start_codon:yes stop_codon:yes gene_type:complete